MKPKLFIGSSREAINYANGIHENLRHDAEVTVWNQGIFNLSQSNLESLLENLERMDFGIFVFAPDDVVQVRGEENTAARDNVVFELGLFVGRLGRERSFVFLPSKQGNFRLPTDLIGVAPGIYESDRTDANFVSATALPSNAVRNRIAQLRPPSQGGEAASAPLQEEEKIEGTREIAEETEADTATETDTTIPGWAEAYFGKDYKRAIGLLEAEIDATDKEEHKRNYRLWLGDAKANVNFRSGIEYLKNIVEEDPENSYGYYVLSGAYAESGYYDESLATLDKGLQFANETDSLFLRKASLLSDLGDTEEAKSILEQLMKDSPEYEPTYSQMAQILINEGLKDKAREVYRTGLNVLPRNRKLLQEYASLLTESGENEAALVVYTDLTTRHPDSSAYLGSLGNTYLSLGLNGLALEAYQKANKKAEELEGWVLANIGNLYKNRAVLHTRLLLFCKTQQ